MKSVIMVNPHAGKGRLAVEAETVISELEAAGYETDLVRTDTEESCAAFLAELAHCMPLPELVLFCGGDGTLSRAVNLMLALDLNIPVGYIPSGTTNDFAISLGLSKQVAAAAAQVVQGRPKGLDVGVFDKKYFIYVASFGAFTQTSYSTTQNLKQSLGHLAYIIEGLKELPKLKAYQVRVETDMEVHEGRYIFGAVTNTTSIGGIIRLNTERVQFDDGLFELILVRMPENLIELSRVIVSLKSGTYDEELITFTKIRKARFECEEPMPWSLDGEFAQGGEQVDISVSPKRFTMRY